MEITKFTQQNLVITDKRQVYQPMPCYTQPNGLVTFKLTFTDAEAKTIKETGKLRFGVSTFDRAVQPIRILASEPKFPVTHKGFFVCNPARCDDAKGEAIMEIDMLPLQMVQFKKTRELWLTVSTFGAPLQVFSFMKKFDKPKLN